MTRKALLAAAMLGALGTVTACTATRPDSPAGKAPNPYLGDRGGPSFGPVSPAERSTNLDRPSPSSTNGNQPDRAAAGGGAR